MNLAPKKEIRKDRHREEEKTNVYTVNTQDVDQQLLISPGHNKYPD